MIFLATFMITGLFNAYSQRIVSPGIRNPEERNQSPYFWVNSENPETDRLPLKKTSANVNIAVYDMLGQKVKSLVNENQAANYYSVQWNGLNETRGKVASGVYLYRIETNDFVKTNKMLLLK